MSEMDDRTEKILDKLDGIADRAARAAYIARLLDYERRQGERRVISDAALELMRGTVDKCGGALKWSELHGAVRRVCMSRDRRGIADFVRAAAKGDDGAVQIAMLMMLGLTLSTELLKLEPEAE